MKAKPQRVTYADLLEVNREFVAMEAKYYDLKADYDRLRDQVEHQEGGIGDAEIRALVVERDELYEHEEKYHASCACSPIRPRNTRLSGLTERKEEER